MMKYICYITAMLFFSFSAVHSKEEHPYGFYKGVLLFSGTFGNPFAFGGDLTDREKDIQKNLSLRSSLGLTPQKLYGVSQLPSAIGLPDTNFKNINSVRGVLEYGISDSFGAGMSLSTLSMDSVNNRELPDYLKLSQNPNQLPSTYIDAFPRTAKFYSDQTYSGVLSYHFLSKNRFDPFVYGEAGLVIFESSARQLKQNYLFESENRRGTGFGAGAGAGMNIFLTPEFGFQVDISGRKKWLRSEHLGNSNLTTAQIQVGVVFNFENIAKFTEK
ncbi:MAG TPA: outer membrane beta-barrel protein [Leptospiraceae bacterium]|nr:outer membrane beta-barrel protein [Leptospiraceae bacterium]